MATTCANKISLAKVYDEPFKHIVVDDFLFPTLAMKCLLKFPEPQDRIWDRSNDDVEVKLRSKYTTEFDFPDPIQSAIRLLNSNIILEAMSDVMGIEKLIPDPYFTGGGLNMMLRGGFLDTHVDGNYHDATGLNRRLNAILFFNPMWEESWGGALGMYGKEEKLIYPVMNRLVVFDTHDKSYHGIPEPIQCPMSESRKSLILYYYTKEPRKNVVWSKPHSALWKKRNMTDKNHKVERSFK